MSLYLDYSRNAEKSAQGQLSSRPQTLVLFLQSELA